MNINIPDKVYKLFVLLGLILIGYSSYYDDSVEKNYFLKIDQFNVLKDSAKFESFIIDNEVKELIKFSENISVKYGIKNPVSNNDSTIYFTRTLSGEKIEVLVSDTINSHWLIYLNRKFKLELLSKKIDTFSERLNDEERLKNQYFEYYSNLRITGIILFSIGILLWFVDTPHPLEKDKLVNQNEKLYPYCQSCGKEFSSVRNYGSDKEGGHNFAFCSECFTGGGFTNPELTKEEFLKDALKSIKNKNWFSRKTLAMRFENLERWNKNKY